MLYELIHFLTYKMRRQELIGKIVLIIGIIPFALVIFFIMKKGFSSSYMVVVSYALIIMSVGGLMVLEAFIKIRKDYNQNSIRDEFASKYGDTYIEEAAENCLRGGKGKGYAFGDKWAAFCTDRYKIVLINIDEIVWVYRYTTRVNFINYKMNMIINTADKKTYSVMVNNRSYWRLCYYLNMRGVIIGYNEKYKELYDSNSENFQAICDINTERVEISKDVIMTGNTILDFVIGIVVEIFKN